MKLDLPVPNPEMCAVSPDRTAAFRFIMKLTGNSDYVAPNCAGEGGPEVRSFTFMSSTHRTYTWVKCSRGYGIDGLNTDEIKRR